MRIVHVTNWYLPGLGYEENCLPFEQAKSGHEVTLLTSSRVPMLLRETPYFAKLYPHGRLGSADAVVETVQVVRLRSISGPYDQVVLAGLARRLSQISPDVVHSHSLLSPSSIRCVLLQRRLNYRLFVDDHSDELNTRLDNPLKSSYARAVSQFYKMHDSSVRNYLPVTAASARFLTTMLGIPPSRLIISGLGADSSVFHPSKAARRECRRRLALSDDDLLIVSAGKFTKKKLVANLIQAFAQASQNYKRARVLLVGDAEPAELERLKELAARLHIQDRVQIHGFAGRTELSEIYNAADIGVWPGAPSITVVEALATGLACILPSEEPAYEVMRECQACATFRGDDIADLSTEIETLICDADYRRKLGLNAHHLVETRLSWRAISKNLLEVYQRPSG